jgi:phosphatidylglycerol:prolipoprotein diacylglycerol transferase
MAYIGGFAALCIIFFRLDKYQISFTSFLKMFFFCVLGGIVGSKILFAVTQISWLIENFSWQNLLLLIPQSGFVFYGGLFGVISVLMIMTRTDADLRKRVFTLAVPAMPLFHAIGRIGCFLTGCCYGKNLSSPLVIGLMEFTKIPVQLIESFAEFVLFFVIIMIDKKKTDADLLRIYLVTYAVIRFADEFLRGDEIRGIYFGISTAQWISIIILAVYLIKFIGNRETVKKLP